MLIIYFNVSKEAYDNYLKFCYMYSIHNKFLKSRLNPIYYFYICIILREESYKILSCLYEDCQDDFDVDISTIWF